DMATLDGGQGRSDVSGQPSLMRRVSAATAPSTIHGSSTESSTQIVSAPAASSAVTSARYSPTSAIVAGRRTATLSTTSRLLQDCRHSPRYALRTPGSSLTSVAAPLRGTL